MSQSQRVIDALNASGFALQPIDIAERTGDPAASVRRTLATLQKAGKVTVKDTNGFPYGTARYVVTSEGVSPTNG